MFGQASRGGGAEKMLVVVRAGGRVSRRAVLFLASEEASYMNGSFMQVDGGLLSKVY